MTDATLTLHTNPRSRGAIARWALDELGEPYDARDVEYGEAMRRPDYLAINPMGKVPALVHRVDGAERVVTETAAICAYLADAFPDAGLGPRDGERADYWRWLFFAAGPVEQAVVARSMGWEVSEERQAMAGFGSFERTMDALAAHLADRDHVCGERFTMADVYVGAQVAWGLLFGTVPERPEFRAYADRLAERPAFPSMAG